ncbi:MAG: hypothetical protein AB7K24_19990 [Gemmataceae bacterium]
MKRVSLLTAAVSAACLAGCVTWSGPLVENPAFVPADPSMCAENPLYVPQGNNAYPLVFETVLDVVDDYFEVSYSNRYDGRIETFPQTAPGVEQPWKPGNPNLRDRVEATCQSIRNRAIVLIQPADGAGYFIHVTVFKELEDLPQPSRSTAGAASFRGIPDVERVHEVVDPAVFQDRWIPRGRNCHIEQLILQRIKECL